MEVPEVKRLKSLEEENARLKKLLAEAMLDKEALQVALGRWHLNAAGLVTGASGSYCAGRAFTSTTSAFTASITLTVWV